jgi:uncharacterized protein
MKRILSIDGGGIRGLIPAILLAELEARTGKACKDQFDLLAGTSTGGIIAVGLLAGFKAQALVDLYANRGAEIFGNEDPLKGAIRPRYSAAPLEKILQDLLGGTWLSDTSGPEIIVPAFCADPYGAWFFTGRSAHVALSAARNVPAFGEGALDTDFRLWQIARATSAAESYFPTAQVTSLAGRTFYMMDGGTHSNNPTVVAAALASALWGEEDLRVLSIGTGHKPGALDGAASVGWGAVEWITKGDLIDGPCMSGTAGAADFAMQCFRGRGIVVDRVQPVLPADATAMDDASPANLARLESVAAGCSLDPYWLTPPPAV